MSASRLSELIILKRDAAISAQWGVLCNARTNGSFILVVRPRVYSRTMKAYTGKERKRGAIGELIRVIRGGKPQYLAFEGDLSRLRRARFLLALDADTGMLLDTAADLVGTALHPLVKAQLSDDKRSITGGFDACASSAEPFSTALHFHACRYGRYNTYDMRLAICIWTCFRLHFAGKVLSYKAFVIRFAIFRPSKFSVTIYEGTMRTVSRML